MRYRGVLIIVALVFLLWMAVPAFEGYHLGYTAGTDNLTTTRLGVQWGKFDPACSGQTAGTPC